MNAYACRRTREAWLGGGLVEDNEIFQDYSVRNNTSNFMCLEMTQPFAISNYILSPSQS